MAYINPVPYRKDSCSSRQATRLYRILEKFVKYPVANFHPWDKRPNCGYFFTGCYWYGSDQNDMAAMMAILSHFGDYDEKLTGVPIERIREMGIQALRYACFTHDTGPADCVRVMGRNLQQAGTKWGGNYVSWPGPRNKFFQGSQVGSGMMMFGIATWIYWDELDEETRQMAYNVLTDYAERWAEYEPRDGTYFNTQSEENAWTAAGIFPAAVMFRDDPRASKWWNGAIKWMLDAASIPLDMYDPEVLSDGTTLRSRMDHITIHPDLTNENHGFVHPSYLSAPLIFRTEMQLLADMAGLEEIPGLRHNWEKIYNTVFKLCLDGSGGMLSIQTQDWWYMNAPTNISFGSMTASLFNDSEAAYIEDLALSTLEKTQAGHANGAIVEENLHQIIRTDAYQITGDIEVSTASGLIIPLLVHTFRGDGPEPICRAQYEKNVKAVRNFPFGGTIINRTEHSMSFLSYRNQCLATVMPEEKSWSITVPPCSIFGAIEFERKTNAFPDNLKRILDVSDLKTAYDEQDFTASLSILRGGQLRQDVSCISLPDERTVFFQHAKAVEDCTIREFTWGLIGVRNENYPYLPEVAKGWRDLYINDDAPLQMKGYLDAQDQYFDFDNVHYAALDSSMSYLVYGSNSVRYFGHHDYQQWKGLEDFLILNRWENKSLNAGEALPDFTLVCMPNTGIVEARTAYGVSMLAYSGSADALILDDTLVFASKLPTRSIIEASFRIDGCKVPLFEGFTSFKGGTYIWKTSTEAKECGYRKAVAFVENDKDFDAVVLPDSTVLIRYSGDSAYRPL